MYSDNAQQEALVQRVIHQFPYCLEYNDVIEIELVGTHDIDRKNFIDSKTRFMSEASIYHTSVRDATKYPTES